jgi:glutaminyl-tRNA synthetase
MRDAMPAPDNFIEEAMVQDLQSGRHEAIVTRFPPEPNGYLHIGHAKAMLADFLSAEKYGGRCNLRFDDTNPTKEETEYVEKIMEDIRWLGCEWGEHLYFASDYFQTLYDHAETLIRRGKAYVCALTPEQLREYRGTLTEPGRNSPWRDRPTQESLREFRAMRAGEFKEGERTLRAKIDMASPNINMRDPVIYRIMFAHHHRTGDDWCIYPMYDYQHPLSDAIEGVTHSMCSLEYEDHRPLYDWFLQALSWENPPHQYEFARLNLNNTIMSKRYLRRLVEEGYVNGWDDPRMPTLCGMRRRGYTPKAIRDFCAGIGLSKANSTVDPALLDHYLRESLKTSVPRRMAVIDPIELVITNYPQGESETVTVANNAENPSMGEREVSFSAAVYIERDDFAIVPPPKYKRLSPDVEVRLMGAYIVRCTGYETDDDGRVTRVLCEYDPSSASGASGRKVRGVLHWVDKATAQPAVIRQYAPLLNDAAEGDFIQRLNPDSLVEMANARVEGALGGVRAGESFQFVRQGYYCADPDGTDALPVFNGSVDLKDTWAKVSRQQTAR